MDGTRGGVIEANNFTPTASFGHGCYIWVVFDLLEIGHDVGILRNGESVFGQVILSDLYTVLRPADEVIAWVGRGVHRAGITRKDFSTA